MQLCHCNTLFTGLLYRNSIEINMLTRRKSFALGTQSLILHQMLTFAGATDFGSIEGNRFFVVISNNHEK